MSVGANSNLVVVCMYSFINNLKATSDFFLQNPPSTCAPTCSIHYCIFVVMCTLEVGVSVLRTYPVRFQSSQRCWTRYIPSTSTVPLLAVAPCVRLLPTCQQR